jgi:hypothetical protein
MKPFTVQQVEIQIPAVKWTPDLGPAVKV